MHDTVAQKNFDPVLPPLPDDFEDELEEESVKIVRLVKNKEPLVSCDRKIRVERKTEEGEIMGPLLFSVNDPIALYFREPPSGGMKPLGQSSWLGL